MAFGSEVRVTIPRVGALGLALIGATVSAWQFWYQNEYGPSQAGRAVALKADIVRETGQRSSEAVRATVRYEAVSGGAFRWSGPRTPSRVHASSAVTVLIVPTQQRWPTCSAAF